MVAIVTEQVVSLARKLVAGVSEMLLDFGCGEIRETLEMRQAVCAPWRRGQGRGMEDACLWCGGRGVGGAIGVFAIEENDTGVEEGEAKGPEEGGKRARWQ